MLSAMGLYRTLLDNYGPQGWWPIVDDRTLVCRYHPEDYSFPKTDAERFEICIGAILTQGTQWYPNVVKAMVQLKLGSVLKAGEWDSICSGKGRYKGRKLSPKVILEEKDLPDLVRPAGYYNQKAQYLRNLSEFLLSLTSAPKRASLLKVKGIGKETADSILLYAFRQPEFVIDAYTKRISQHLSLVSGDYDSFKTFFENNLPRDIVVYQEFHALLVEHAKRHYRRKPYTCPLKAGFR